MSPHPSSSFSTPKASEKGKEKESAGLGAGEAGRAMITPERLQAEREALILEKQRTVEKIIESHDAKVREVFHLERWTSMLGYDPEEAKKDESPVFQDFKSSKYNLFDRAYTSERKPQTRRARAEQLDHITLSSSGPSSRRIPSPSPSPTKRKELEYKERRAAATNGFLSGTPGSVLNLLGKGKARAREEAGAEDTEIMVQSATAPPPLTFSPRRSRTRLRMEQSTTESTDTRGTTTSSAFAGQSISAKPIHWRTRQKLEREERERDGMPSSGSEAPTNYSLSIQSASGPIHRKTRQMSERERVATESTSTSNGLYTRKRPRRDEESFDPSQLPSIDVPPLPKRRVPSASDFDARVSKNGRRIDGAAFFPVVTPSNSPGVNIDGSPGLSPESPSKLHSSVKRVILRVRRPPPLLTNPRQKPDKPLFGNSLPAFLASYTNLGAGDVGEAELRESARKAARSWGRIRNARKEGRLFLDPDLAISFIEEFKTRNPDNAMTIGTGAASIGPQSDDYWNEVVKAATAKARRMRALTGQAMASNVASRVRASWEAQIAKEERLAAQLAAQEEKRVKAIARLTLRMVLDEWRKAVAHVHQQVKLLQVAEEERKGKEHLNALLDQSGQILEAQHGDLSRFGLSVSASASRSRTASVVDTEDSDDEDSDDLEEGDDEGLEEEEEGEEAEAGGVSQHLSLVSSPSRVWEKEEEEEEEPPQTPSLAQEQDDAMELDEEMQQPHDRLAAPEDTVINRGDEAHPTENEFHVEVNGHEDHVSSSLRPERHDSQDDPMKSPPGDLDPTFEDQDEHDVYMLATQHSPTGSIPSPSHLTSTSADSPPIDGHSRHSSKTTFVPRKDLDSPPLLQRFEEEESMPPDSVDGEETDGDADTPHVYEPMTTDIQPEAGFDHQAQLNTMADGTVFDSPPTESVGVAETPTLPDRTGKGDEDDGQAPEEISSDRNEDEQPEQANVMIKEYLRPYAVTAVDWDPSAKVTAPLLLRGSLRPYQHAGLEWLASLHTNMLNGILADEMGLGKTIQTISLLAHLACDRGIWGPHLIIVPTSVLLNWEMEFKKFLPGFKILSYHGTTTRRKELRRGWTDKYSFNVCITSYTLASRDGHIFKRKPWYYMVLDEAHMIKNFKSQRFNILLTFRSFRRLLLTGTPLQNNLTELWSLLQFLMAGSDFVSLKEFGDLFSNPLEKAIESGSAQDDETLAIVSKLHTVLRPYLLRRLKRDVEKELPSKFEHLVLCRLSKRQRFLYDEFMSRAATRYDLESGVYQKIANILMQLRKVCNHPDLFEVRPIVTSFAMDRSAVADYEISELLVRRRLLQNDDHETLNLGALGLRFVDFQNTPREAADAARRLDATSRFPFIGELPGEPPPKDTRTIEGFRRYSAYRKRVFDIAQWTHDGYVNRLRCSQAPIYGSELLRTVSSMVKPLVPLASVRGVGVDHLIVPRKTQTMVKSYIQRAEEMRPFVVRFAFVTPSVVALDMPRIALAGTVDRMDLTSFSSDFDGLLHTAAVKLQIAFPDASLLQYDCGKLQELARLLHERKAGGHRVLIFTQMTRILDMLEKFLNFHGHLYLRLDGATKIEDRQYLTELFNADPRIFCFIASSRSGGVGINLTGADTVVFYDSDFNPQMDRQCEDRAHRIGQIRDVHIYRFISQYTVEEAMLRKANMKRSLDDLVIQKGEFDWRTLFNDEAALGAALGEFEDVEDARAAAVAAREEVDLVGADAADFGDAEGMAPTQAIVASEPDQAVVIRAGDDVEEEDEDEEVGGTIADYMLAFVQHDLEFFKEWREWKS